MSEERRPRPRSRCRVAEGPRCRPAAVWGRRGEAEGRSRWRGGNTSSGKPAGSSQALPDRLLVFVVRITGAGDGARIQIPAYRRGFVILHHSEAVSLRPPSTEIFRQTRRYCLVKKDFEITEILRPLEIMSWPLSLRDFFARNITLCKHICIMEAPCRANQIPRLYPVIQVHNNPCLVFSTFIYNSQQQVNETE